MSERDLTKMILSRARRQRREDEKEKIEEMVGESVVLPIDEEERHFFRNAAIGAGAIVAGVFFYRRKKTGDWNKQVTMGTDVRLAPNFILGEFLVSSEAPELKQYTLSVGQFDNVKRVTTILQLMRNRYGKKIVVTSGGRPNDLIIKSGKYKGMTLVQMLTEKKYSPSSFSQHMDFSAADFTVEIRADLTAIYRMLLDLEKDGTFGPMITQVILYVENGMPDFIHLGVRSVLDDFGKIIKPENKYLLGIVTAAMTNDGKKHRNTKFVKFSLEALDNAIHL